ncbi:MAG: RCC1 domain-containing protein [Sandaracinaceae bacterium]
MVTSDHALYCWGSNDLGGLGTGDFRSADAPVRVAAPPVTEVELSHHRGCAITVDRHVVCWGINANGESRPSTERDPLPANRPPVAYCGMGEDPDADHDNFVLRPTEIADVEGVVAIALGYHRTCVATEAGTVSCWGENRDDVFGAPTPRRSFVRRDVAHPGATALVTNTLGTYALDAAGRLSTVMTRAASDEDEPVQAPPAVAFRELEWDDRGGCGRTDDRVVCWGQGGACFMDDEQIGEWSVQVRARDVSVGWGTCMRCFVDDEGAARCWPSYDDRDQLADDEAPFEHPWTLELPPVTRIEMGDYGGCAIAEDGQLWCFDLGTSSTPAQRRPHLVTLTQ